jgi:Ribbon-helix-helix protein, copG family
VLTRTKNAGVCGEAESVVTTDVVRDRPATATYSMSEAMIERVKEEAAKREVSASKLVRDAIERHLVELAIEEGAVPEIVRLPGGDERPLVELRPVMISGTSSLNKDNPCFGGGEVTFWRPLSPRMLGALQPRLARLVAALHVEEKHRRNGGNASDL